MNQQSSNLKMIGIWFFLAIETNKSAHEFLNWGDLCTSFYNEPCLWIWSFMMVHNIFEKLAEISIGQEIFVKFLKSSLVLRTFQIYGFLNTFRQEFIYCKKLETMPKTKWRNFAMTFTLNLFSIADTTQPCRTSIISYSFQPLFGGGFLNGCWEIWLFHFSFEMWLSLHSYLNLL